MKKVLPYLYIIFGIIILIDTFVKIQESNNLYRIIFNWTTENKFVFLGVKTVFSALFIYIGLSKLKNLREGL